MFKKQDGGIDMVSLILTVVIPETVKSCTGASAAVTMMVGLEDKLVTSYDPSNRGRQHGVIHAKHHQIGTVNLPDKCAYQYGNRVLSGKLRLNDKNNIQNEKFLSKSLFLDVKSYIRVKFPCIGAVCACSGLYYRDRRGSAWKRRVNSLSPINLLEFSNKSPCEIHGHSSFY